MWCRKFWKLCLRRLSPSLRRLSNATKLFPRLLQLQTTPSPILRRQLNSALPWRRPSRKRRRSSGMQYPRRSTLCNMPLTFGSSTAASSSFVTVEIGADRKTYCVHKTLLEHHSGYFSGVFNGPWKEAEDGVVPLEDIEPGICTLRLDLLVQVVLLCANLAGVESTYSSTGCTRRSFPSRTKNGPMSSSIPATPMHKQQAWR